MRRAFPVWPLLAVLLSAGPAAAQPTPNSVVSRILEMKPVAADDADSPLRKLQKERYNARLAAARVQAQAVQVGAGASTQGLTDLLMTLAENGAELEAKPADRVKWYQPRVDVLKEQERLAAERVKAGGVSPIEAHLITAARADAEIDLLKLKESLEQKK